MSAPTPRAHGSPVPAEPRAAAGEGQAEGPWWHRPFRTFQTNLREIDAGLDVEATLDAIQAHGADTWLLSVGGILAGHPSDLESQTVNPHLAQRPSGDLVGDATAAAQARGVRVLARMDFSKIDAARAERHPEWCFVSPDGEMQIYNGYRSVCPSGEYYQREMFAVIAEVLERYPLAGFFFNWMSFNEVDYSRRYWGVCQCEACRRGFAEHSPGTQLPRGPEDAGYARWRQYADGVLADLNQRMQEHVHRLAPEAALIQGDRADITFHEANNAVGRPLWHQSTADAVDAARTADPARQVFVNAVAFVDMPYRWAGEDPRHLEAYAVQTIAHGAQPSTYIMGAPEHSPFPGLAASGRISRFHRDHQREYTGLVPTARTALVRPAGRRGEFEGWHTALSEAHAPFQVLQPAALAEGLGSRAWDLLILPDVGELDRRQVTAIERHVEAGGHVITTGSSAWSAGRHQLDAAGRLRQRAVFDAEESLRSLHIDIAPEGAQGPVHVPVLGELHVLGVDEAAGEVDAGWPVLGRALYGPPEKCYGNEPTGHPGSVAWHAGAGGGVGVLPWRPGQVLRELGLSAVGAALAELVAARSPGALWSTSLSPQVQIVPGRGAMGPMVHLLNRSGEREQRFVDPIVQGPAELSIPCEAEPRAVRALVAGQELEWNSAQGLVQVTTPSIEAFEVIALEI